MAVRSRTPVPVSRDLAVTARSAQDGKRKGSKAAWKVLGNAAALGSALVSTRVLNATWKAATGRRPPTKPESPELAQREALAWAAFSGATTALIKMYATRRAAGYWVRSTGTLPPGFLEKDKKKKKKDR
jgi:uncharacterized protein DUF4235